MRLHVDAQGKLTYEYASAATLKIFGANNEDIVAGLARPLDLTLEEDSERVQEALRRNIEERHPGAVEFRIRRNGTVRWIRALGGELKEAADGGYFWSVYCADVTEEKEQARALIEAKATAEQAVAAKGAFLAMMSHEIRTPMAGVLSLAELMSKTPMSTDQSHMMDMIHDSALSLLSILDDILDFSRIEAQKLELEPQAFDLRELTDSAVGVFAARAQQANLSLYLTLDWRLGAEYWGDANRIRQIVNNLISNALKFTSSGHVEVRVDMVQETEKGQHLRFSVIDTGIGISPDQLDRLFRPFTQAEASTTRRFGGTGLGLSICRRLAQLMGGNVTLASDEGRGTCAALEVTLPVLKASAAMDGVEGKRALVCTRHAMLERELAHALSAMGFSVIEVDPAEVAEFTADDADIYVADASLFDEGFQVEGVASIRLLADTDSRGFYRENGSIMLCASPLLWSSTRDACRAALGLDTAHGESLTTNAPSASSAHILVAEDHPVNREVIKRQLDLLGYASTMAEDGLRAWEELRAGRYDLLITDCHMPVLDGYALTRRIREREIADGTHLPIIALSASALPEEIERCHQAGMDGFLAKPVQMEELQSKVAELLGDGVKETVAPTSRHDQLDYLAQVFGSDDQVEKLLDGLVKAGRVDIEKLDKAMAAGDVPAQHDLIHRIVGSLRLINPHMAEASAGEPMCRRREEVVAQLESIERMMIALRDRA